jgi:hypothetical protein
MTSPDPGQPVEPANPAPADPVPAAPAEAPPTETPPADVDVSWVTTKMIFNEDPGSRRKIFG